MKEDERKKEKDASTTHRNQTHDIIQRHSTTQKPENHTKAPVFPVYLRILPSIYGTGIPRKSAEIPREVKNLTLARYFHDITAFFLRRSRKGTAKSPSRNHVLLVKIFLAAFRGISRWNPNLDRAGRPYHFHETGPEGPEIYG